MACRSHARMLPCLEAFALALEHPGMDCKPRARAQLELGALPHNYGVGSGYEPPKISELPNVAGQSCCGAGRVGTAVPFAMASWAAARQASIAGQSAAFRVSFQTPAP